MTIQSLADILIGLAVVGWIVYRQLTWRIVSISKMWKMPLILGVIGIAMLAQGKGGHPITAIDIAVLAVELVVSVGIGLVMGRLAVFRTRTIRPGEPGDPRLSRRDHHRDGGQTRYVAQAEEPVLNPDGSMTVLENRTGWLGLVLWIVLILVRIGMDAVAVELGSVLATATGVILVMVAANRAARVFIIAARVQNRAAVTA